MKIKSLKDEIPEFKAGQVWRLGEDRLKMELVGRWVIQYRHFKGRDKRPPTLFADKREMGQMLTDHNATLVQA